MKKIIILTAVLITLTGCIGQPILPTPVVPVTNDTSLLPSAPGGEVPLGAGPSNTAGELITNVNSSGGSATVTTPAVATTTTQPTYTMAQVAAANSETRCWTVVNSNVYDITNFLDKHPGGKEKAMKLCGIDGTAIFTAKHGGQPNQEQTLAGLKIGLLQK